MAREELRVYQHPIGPMGTERHTNTIYVLRPSS
jgi:hypothetical protein